MMLSPFLKSAAVILAKRAIVGLLRTATFAEFKLGRPMDRCVYCKKNRQNVFFLLNSSEGQEAEADTEVA